MAQSVHAAFSFADEHPVIAHEWHRDSQFLVVVNVPDQFALLSLVDDARERGIDVSLWREPDVDGEITAIALAPVAASKTLCSSLPLAGRVMA
jgi:peptidyl-tRNA hydrolase